MLQLIRAGKLNPTVSLVVPLSGTVEAFDRMMSRKVIGKVGVSFRFFISLHTFEAR